MPHTGKWHQFSSSPFDKKNMPRKKTPISELAKSIISNYSVHIIVAKMDLSAIQRIDRLIPI